MDLDSKVAVIIVNWNRRKLLLEAVNSCMSSTWKDLIVIVVDNGSHDGSNEFVTDAFPAVKWIQNSQNEGFAKGSNQGLERAIEEGTDYVLFLNNDATLASDAIGLMAVFLDDHKKVGAVAPYIFYHYKRELIWFGGGIVSFWRGRIAHRNIRRSYINEKHKQTKSDYLTGCALMARTTILEEIGGFDETMGMYSEDVDLSLKIKRKKMQLWVLPQAKAYHRVSVSTGGELSPFKAFHRGRSNTVLIKRWAKWWEYPTLVLGGLFGGLIISLKLLMQGQVVTVSALWLGILNGLKSDKIPDRFEIGN